MLAQEGGEVNVRIGCGMECCGNKKTHLVRGEFFGVRFLDEGKLVDGNVKEGWAFVAIVLFFEVGPVLTE